MRDWRRKILIIAGICGLSACQEYDQNETSPRVLPPIASQAVPSDHYLFADSVCQTEKPKLNLSSGVVFGRAQGENGPGTKLTVNPTDFSRVPIVSAPFLKTPNIALTVVGGIYQRECPDSYGDNRLCTDQGRYIDWDMQLPPSPLHICQITSQFGRDTYEGIALTSSYYLEQVLARFGDAYGKQLPPVTLEIMPQYSSMFMHEVSAQNTPIRLQTYFTHNLAYFPRRNKIAVFPETKEDQAYYDQAGHLWESPFGLAHEAGHHLEQQIAEQVADDLRTIWRPELHAHESLARGIMSEGQAERLAVRNALSEGFADLVGFYAIDAREDLVVNLVGIGENRNPASSVFTMQQKQIPKVLTVQAVSTLFNQPCSESECQIKTNSHDAGAILAHLIHRIFTEAALRIPELQQNKAQQPHVFLRNTIVWFKASLERMQSMQVPNEQSVNLFNSANTGIKVMVLSLAAEYRLGERETLELKRNACQLSKMHLPTASEPPFSAADGSCNI